MQHSAVMSKTKFVFKNLIFVLVAMASCVLTLAHAGPVVSHHVTGGGNYWTPMTGYSWGQIHFDDQGHAFSFSLDGQRISVSPYVPPSVTNVQVSFPAKSPVHPVADGIDADATGTHFYAGGNERVWIAPDGTMHYNGSEVVTLKDLRFVLQYVATTGDLERARHDWIVQLVGLTLAVLLGLSMRSIIGVTRSRWAAFKFRRYQTRQPKADGTAYRDGDSQ